MTDPAVADRPPRIPARQRLALVGGVGLVILIADQLSKSWALEELSDGSVIDLFWTLRFNLAFNTGMAFSQGSGSGAIIGVIVCCIVVALIVFAFRVQSRVQLLLLGVIIGGALGNLVDRATRVGETNPFTGEVAEGFLSGAVVDFVDVQWWPVFNVADAAVVVGGIALALVTGFTPVEDTETSAEPTETAPEAPGTTDGTPS